MATNDTRVILLCAQCGNQFECRVLAGDRLMLSSSLNWAERERWTGNGVSVERGTLCRVCHEQHRKADSWKDGTFDVGFSPE